MIRVSLRFADKSEWVKVFDPRDCTVFVAGDNSPQIGEVVRIDVTVTDTGPKVILRGKVISRREQPAGSAPAGCNIALGPEEREKINYMNGFVRGGLLNLRERRRLPLRIPVTYGGVAGPCKSFTRDINDEGVFVVAEDPLPEESEIHLLFDFPGSDKPTSVAGIVSHTVVIEDEDIPGMGILFQFKEGQQRGFAKMIDELEQLFLAGKLPEALLL